MKGYQEDLPRGPPQAHSLHLLNTLLVTISIVNEKKKNAKGHSKLQWNEQTECLMSRRLTLSFSAIRLQDSFVESNNAIVKRVREYVQPQIDW